MKIYLVGGAVRDSLLKLQVTDKDWLVVGSNINEMTKLGYKLVGKDFPVFLHPITHEEYALARTERKLGHGYKGFKYHATSKVTLEEDLLRRDLTINAIAQDHLGNLYDPFNGIQDIKKKVLKHISLSFKDDPLRVLRVARFAAKFAHLNFYIHNSTLDLMKDMCNTQELLYLKPERIWKETSSALNTLNPHVYFEVLRKCGALSILFPEINKLYGVPAPAKWHPEIDTGIHTMMTLKIASQLTNDISVRFASLCHDLGKSLTPKHLWPRHYGHGIAGIPLVKKLCKRLKIPNEIKSLSILAVQTHDLLHNIYEQNPEDILNIYNIIDAWRQPKRVKQIALISESDARGRTMFESINYTQGKYFIEIYKYICKIKTKDIFIKHSNINGLDIKKLIYNERLKLLKKFINLYKIK
ncbi:multifunctional CCA addition/repair protein [Enterobacteriaceae endosymbiont of Neohaemonia nigricornis]|uniref:multifunctional CCA addition/repair protein n=1 Tax=Enterobacteriaceae endosymbiont of Neohaemonia nigricornis TaxID=2675792 RepID=UPI0014492D28|nr:multifunctional CCA addition/repair protein [Enterobacteriaceae endosymbiont of Neohaemonia nigricornis]QJC30432.1 multifunctional CCA addition/repair protein [Enterobacteriaceae endosymbiont of Neohaemonia nigricornis]